MNSSEQQVTEKPLTGLVFDIKTYSVHDGPGIRTTVFLKGCPLSCAWCHNPEGISPVIQKMFTESRCIGCNHCREVCEVELNPALCRFCQRCAAECPSKATEFSGKYMTVAEVMEFLLREEDTMRISGGGITVSGGEPLLQKEFLLELLQQCGKQGIHRTVDTSGHCNPAHLREIAGHCELFLYDLKHMDPEIHRHWTGVDNTLILQNLVMLSELGKEIIIRIPLIAGINDDEGNILRTKDFLASLPGGMPAVELLPYHSVAAQKYLKLGIVYCDEGMEAPSRERVEELRAIFQEYLYNQ